MSRHPKVGLCTDSSAQLPRELIERFDVEVVPMTVTLDERDYLDGVDLCPDDFYAMFTGDHRPSVSISQPSPGQFAVAYDDLLARGCTGIVSIHDAAASPGTVSAARLAARGFGVPIRLVDSGTAGFGVSCCVWAAGDTICCGASIDEAAAVAEALAPAIGSVFTTGTLDLPATGTGTGVALIARRWRQVQVIDRVHSAEQAITTMAAATTQWGERLKVAVGVADAHTGPHADELHRMVASHPAVEEAIFYRIGPSAGPPCERDTLGCFMFPASPARSIRAAN